MAVVYLASSLALAALELLVHIDHERALSTHVAIPVDFDETLILTVAQDSLPENWSRPEALVQTRALGDAWLRSKASVLLRVPSVIIPAENNYLFNPQHPDALVVRTGEPETFRYDPRLLKTDSKKT
ncbi:hypothetical protein BH24DEI2_BH24DEI2_07660 [soil metagenome]